MSTSAKMGSVDGSWERSRLWRKGASLLLTLLGNAPISVAQSINDMDKQGLSVSPRTAMGSMEKALAYRAAAPGSGLNMGHGSFVPHYSLQQLSGEWVPWSQGTSASTCHILDYVLPLPVWCQGVSLKPADQKQMYREMQSRAPQDLSPKWPCPEAWGGT